jgi:uncharacterized membrane protein
MQEILQNFVVNFPKPLAVIILSMTPFGELRLGIPIGILKYELHFVYTYFLAIIGNLVPAILILLGLKRLDFFLRNKSEKFAKLFDWIYDHTRKKGEKNFVKWGLVALILFVAIPLPMTGAWSGSIFAVLFQIPFKKALPLILVGLLISGTIVTILSLSIPSMFQSAIN